MNREEVLAVMEVCCSGVCDLCTHGLFPILRTEHDCHARWWHPVGDDKETLNLCRASGAREKIYRSLLPSGHRLAADWLNLRAAEKLPTGQPGAAIDSVLTKYPNIEACAVGTVIGKLSEWPVLRAECKAILLELSELSTRPGGLSMDETVKRLNDLLEIDRDAVSALVNSRANCNDGLAEHSYVTVISVPPYIATVGMLGILNGLFRDDTKILAVNLAADNHTVTSFTLVERQLVAAQSVTVSRSTIQRQA